MLNREHRRHLNPRAAMVVAVLGLIALATAVALFLYQQSRGRSAWLAEAKKLIAAREDALALSYLMAYLDREPRDIAALELAADTLARTGESVTDWLKAIRLYEQILRSDRDPRSLHTRKALRALVRLQLAVGPQLPRSLQRYRTADLLAGQLLALDDRDAEALRLRGLVKLRLATLGDDAELSKAIDLYEQTRRLEPGAIGGALGLAAAYRDLKKDQIKANAVMDELIAANPSAPAYLARSHFLEETARGLTARALYDHAEEVQQRAEADLRRAVEKAPRDLDTCLAAAEHALHFGRAEEARRHLDRVPEELRESSRFRVDLGIVHLQENRVEEAIATWRRGLLRSGGTDAELTWWLADIQLERGRLTEAKTLIDQYRRLVGGDRPPSGWHYLEGVRRLKQGQPTQAIAELQQARGGASAGLQGQVALALGHCHEALRDEPSALSAYREAFQNDPSLTAARLCYVRLLQSNRPTDAHRALREGIDRKGDDPELLAALVHAELDRQLDRPVSERSWEEMDNDLERARQAAPDHPDVAIAEAAVLRARGHPAAAAQRLAEAAKAHPREPSVWIARAEAHVEEGDLDGALAVLEEARRPEASGDQPEIRILRARLLDALGREIEAREALVRDLDRLGPESRARLWMALGDLYRQRHQPIEACRSFEQGARLRPEDPLPRLRIIETALEAEPDEAEARRQIGDALAALERIGGEEGAYTRLGRLLVLLDQAAQAEGTERVERLTEAEALNRLILAQLPSQSFPYVLQGRLRELRGQPEEAVIAYEKALSNEDGSVVEPRLLTLYARLGRKADLQRLRRHRSQQLPNLDRHAAESSARNGQYERAERLARRVVAGDPESLDARLWQARLLNSLGKPEEAEATLRQLIAKQPEALGPRLALLAFQASRKQDEDAHETVSRILNDVKGLDRPEFVHAQCWRIAGNREKADAAYRAALAKWPEDDRVVRGVADFFQATGRSVEAERVLRKAMERDPSRRWAARALALLLSERREDAAARREALAIVAPTAGQRETPEDQLARAVVLSRGTDIEEVRMAADLLDRLLEDLPADLPTSVRSRALLARLYLRLKEPREAARIAAQDAGMGASPEVIRWHVETLLAAGDLDAAGRQLDRLPESDLDAALLRARWQTALQHPDDAAKGLEAAFQAASGTPGGEAFGRAAVRFLLKIDRDAEAERIAVRMAALWPSTAVVRAVVVAHRGRHAEALDLFESAVAAADPDGLREISRNLLALARAERLRSAVVERIERIFSAIRKRRPEDPEFLTSLAHLRHLQGRYREEVQLYQQAIQRNPTDRDFLNNLAWTLSEELKSPREALPWIEALIRRVGSSPAAHPYLDTRGVIFTRLGRYDEAIADLEAAAEAHPAPETFAHLARAYYLAGQYAQFLQARDQARKAGLTLERLQPGERDDLAPLLLGPEAPRAPRPVF